MLTSLVAAQNVGISNNAATPDPAALLDLDVTSGAKRGLLIPRMTEAERLAITTAAPENSLLVYQTDVGAAQDTTNARGFWYWDNTSATWIHLGAGRVSWSLDGNTLTTVATANGEYLGTRGTAPSFHQPNLVFRVGAGPVTDPPAMQMGYSAVDHESGFVGLGTAAPATERLEVQGAIRVGQSDELATPREGTIRYGTFDGGAAEPWNAANSPDPNLNWHWGTLVENDVRRWARLENAEELITPPQLYAKDTVMCDGGTGDAFRGFLSPEPVTSFTNTPANVYSPFATNYGPITYYGNYRVQYLYRYQELVDAGLCFPATITAIAFFCLDQEYLLNPANPPAYPNPYPTSIDGDIRGAAASTVGGLQGPGARFGANNTAPYMDDMVRTQAPVRGSFTLVTPAPGWVNFNLTTPITLAAGDNLIIDFAWSRTQGVGEGPRVEVEDPGYECTKWVLWPQSNATSGNRDALRDNPLTAGATVNSIPPSTTINAHSKRPVTRFTGTVATPTVKQAWANYLNYDGGLMIGDAAWAAAPGNFKGPGTVKAQNGVYDGTLVLSDHVFDRYFDGMAGPADNGAITGYAYTGLAQLRERLERERHLPNMPSRAQWEASGGASLGKLATGLWESVEDQALYITQLEKDLSALEEMTFGDGLTPGEARRLADEVRASRRLTEAQKAHLVQSIMGKVQPRNTEGQ